LPCQKFLPHLAVICRICPNPQFLIPNSFKKLPTLPFILCGTDLAYLCRPNYLTKIKNNRVMATKKLSITPLHDRVIVKPAAAEEKSAGGIIIPDTAKEKPQRGTVLAAGPGKKDEPVTVKTGDTVLYGKYAGTEITVDGNDYLIMRESDILAIV
jgi:chaperonin GroES